MSELVEGRSNGGEARTNGHGSLKGGPVESMSGSANGHAAPGRPTNGTAASDGSEHAGPGARTANGSAAGDGSEHVAPGARTANGTAAGDGSEHAGPGARTANGTAAGDGARSAVPGPIALAAQIEAILFVADAPVAAADLARALDVRPAAIERALAELARSYDDHRGIRLQQAGGQVQLVSAPEAAGAIGRFLGLEQSTRLSRAALETLSIIAYRQPVTRPEIDALRGVDSDGVMRSLLARGLVEPLGRRSTVGLPVEYGTTFLFLEYFGLTGLADLPPIEVTPAATPETLPLFGLPPAQPAAGDDASAIVTAAVAVPGTTGIVARDA